MFMLLYFCEIKMLLKCTGTIIINYFLNNLSTLCAGSQSIKGELGILAPLCILTIQHNRCLLLARDPLFSFSFGPP